MREVRRFQILDAMVLVGALALAFAFVQYQGLLWTLPHNWFLPRNGGLWAPEDGNLAVLIASFLFPMTVALLILRLIKPRPRRRRLLNQPGFSACFSSLIMIVFLYVNSYRLMAINYGAFHQVTVQDLVTLNYQIEVSFAPASTWALMVACGAWNAERSWIDRAGRVVGLLWIVLIPLRWFSPY